MGDESEYSLRKAVLNNDAIEAKLKADLLTRKWFFVHHEEEEVKHDDISANELFNLAIQNEGLSYIIEFEYDEEKAEQAYQEALKGVLPGSKRSREPDNAGRPPKRSSFAAVFADLYIKG